jgi:hypothetical protein
MMMGVTAAPASDTSFSPSPLLRTVAKICHPALTKRKTHAFPMPLDAPVITTVLGKLEFIALHLERKFVPIASFASLYFLIDSLTMTIPKF